MFLLLPFLNIGIIYIYSEKERKKLKRFVSSTVNEWVYLDTFSSKRKKSRKKEKKKKKKERKKKGERRKGLLRETFVFNTACWLNKADSLKGKEKRKKELFLKSHKYLFGRHLLKLCYILNAPPELKSIGYVVYLSSCLLLHISFSASYRLHLFSLNVLFALKTLQGNVGNLTTVKYILF